MSNTNVEKTERNLRHSNLEWWSNQRSGCLNGYAHAAKFLIFNKGSFIKNVLEKSGFLTSLLPYVQKFVWFCPY